MTVVFVGNATGSIMDTPFSFNRFGQRADIPKELADRVMAIGPSGHREFPLLTEEEYASTGLTDALVKLNYYADQRGTAPAEFVAMKRATTEMLHQPVPVTESKVNPKSEEVAEHDPNQ